MSDPQDRAEALDSDKIGVPDDQDVEPEYPPEHLSGADEYGITAAEERVDEPLEERLQREDPDPLLDELEGRDHRPGGEGTGGDLGRIVEPGTDDDVTEFVDREADAVGHSDPADDLSAEEAAMHSTQDPPMGSRGGGYVD